MNQIFFYKNNKNEILIVQCVKKKKKIDQVRCTSKSEKNIRPHFCHQFFDITQKIHETTTPYFQFFVLIIHKN